MRPAQGLPRGARSTVPPFRAPHSAFRTRRAGFTLIEVLVVISVISILLALLFPGVRAALWSSDTQNTRTLVAQLGVAIELFRDMQGSYPEGSAFSGEKLVSELGSLLKVRSSSFIDSDGNGTRDTVVDAWGRPFVYTRYVATAATTNPGDSNGEDGIQPLQNPSRFDVFSGGAFGDKVVAGAAGGDLGEGYQTEALKNDGSKYNHDGEKVKAGSTPTGEVNYYFGNW
ncbi:MAG TPA: prepilin-type N-terminal cleavage/methylation domain-containing protein [Planctomycetota bacterium]|nr:prepilin-type N-terminal cleavage/methylation domain-containing protein [Planctomycetota bacterium]